VLAILLAGCSGSVLIVFNHAGHDLTVLSYDTVGQSAEYVIPKGHSHEVASPTRLVVKSEVGIWEYPHFPKLKREYRGGGGIRPRNFKFQIEEDGAIYILDPGTKTVVTNLPVQPDGFPVRPK